MPLLNMSKPFNTENDPPRVRFEQIDAEYVGQRIDNYLLRLCRGVPKSHIYRALRSGQVRVNKGRVSSDYRVQLGDEIRIPPMRLPKPDETRPAPAAEFAILYEDEYLLVINKPQGVAVHGGSGVAFGVVEQLRSARPQQKFLELAHRLDRDTSGLLILAKRRRALVALHDMFRQGQIEKFYLALVDGDWVNQRQHISLPLQRWLTASGERRVRVDPQGRPAHTVINLQQRYGRFSLVEADLRTGRTHQIRVHLAHLGFAIVGDDKYGSDATRAEAVRMGFKRMFLHASRLRFKHPISGEFIELFAPLPNECQRFLNLLEK